MDLSSDVLPEDSSPGFIKGFITRAHHSFGSPLWPGLPAVFPGELQAKQR